MPQEYKTSGLDGLEIILNRIDMRLILIKDIIASAANEIQ